MVACEIFRPLTYVPLVLLRSVTMKRPSRNSSRAWCFDTLPLGSIKSLPCTRPTLISLLSNASLRSLPPFSLMTIVNIEGSGLRSPHVAAHAGGVAAIVEALARACQLRHTPAGPAGAGGGPAPPTPAFPPPPRALPAGGTGAARPPPGVTVAPAP